MFDQNMLNELSKLKVDRKRKVEEKESEHQEQEQGGQREKNEFEQIPTEDELYELNDYVEDDPGLNGLSDFINETISDKAPDPRKYINEIDPENDAFLTDEKDTKAIIISGKRTTREIVDQSGNQVKSKFMDEAGNLNVVYGEPGKNVVNRKSIQEQRLEVKMDALSGLLSRFKSEDDIEEEDNEENVIYMDKEVENNKDIRRIEQVMNIQNDLEIKVSLVANTLNRLSKEIQEGAKLPDINLDITGIDYLRGLYLKRSVDDMDVARIFTLALFLELPEKFPTHDTYEQVHYRNSQVGAKTKSIELKRLITYLSSESEFNRTVELVDAITRNSHIDYTGVVEVFNFKCKETLKALMSKYLKNDSVDPLNKLNTISIKKEVQMKYRNLESTISLLESLKGKLKFLPPSLKEQVRKTNEQIQISEEKVKVIGEEIKKMEQELTIMLMLNVARQSSGYNRNFVQNMPKDEIGKHLQEYNVKIESEPVQNVFSKGLNEHIMNEILKSR